jgi:DNA repair protein RecO (recombination protein O)
MSVRESEALILKSYSLAEADKIIVMLTREHGVIRGVAKGAKRLKSQFGGSLEPFSIVDVTYYQKENIELSYIRHIELVKSYFGNASDPAFLQQFAYLVELLIEFAPPHDPDERLYRMAKACLEAASEMPESLESIAVYFEIWLLRLCGYLPDWKVCDRCRNELDRNETAGLQINFHLLCNNCKPQRSGLSISSNQRQMFLNALKVAPVKFAGDNANEKSDLSEISIVLRRIIAQILGREVVGEKQLTAYL